jgi:hypothetical protein
MVLAQNTGAISGTLLDAKTMQPLSFVVVSIQNSSFTQISAKDGTFIYNPCRRTVNSFKTQSYKEALYPVTITSGESIDLGVILLEKISFLTSKIPSYAYSRTTSMTIADLKVRACYNLLEMRFSKPPSIGDRHVSNSGFR